MLVLFSLPIVNSAVVTDLDINFLNSPAVVNKDLNFQATWDGGDINVLYWRFDTDGNVTTSGIGTPTIYLEDGFDTNNNDWHVTSGVWDISGGSLNQTSATSTSEIFKDSGQSNDWSSNGLEAMFTVEATNIALAITDATTLGASDGYLITTSGAEYKLKTIISGVETDRLIITNSVSAGTQIKFVFDTNGLISGFRNGVLEGSVTDTNFNSFRYAIFRGNQNSGVRDVNITSKTAINFVIESGASQTHTFTTAGQKTIQLTAQNPDGNASTSLDLNIFGALNIHVYDENKSTAISGATVTFDGNNFTTGVDGNVLINLSNITTGEFTINVDVNSDFTARNFVFDLNQFSSQDLNLLILETIIGANREYKIFQPNKTTLITNSFVEWRRNGIIPNGISQRTKTDSDGLLSFFGQQDANYVMRITDTVADLVRDYNGTLVTFKIPLNEILITQTLTPFNLQIGGLAQQTVNGLSADHTFLIFSDTVSSYDVLVDVNVDFFDRAYSVSSVGGQAILEVQPFLLPTNEAVQVKIILTNSNSLTPIKRAIITSKIGSVLLENITTDDGGEGQMSFRVGTPYQLFFNVDGVDVSFLPTSAFASYTAKAGDILLKIKLNITDTNVGSTLQVSSSVDFEPGAGVIIADGSTIDLNQTISVDNSTVSTINTLVQQGVTTLSDTNTTGTFISQSISSATVGTVDPVIVTTTVTTVSGETFQFVQRYSVQKDFSFLTSLTNVKNQELGEFGALILALFISIGVMGFVYSTTTGFTTDPAPSFAIGLIVLGLFTTIAYVPVWLWWISAFAGIAVYIRQRKV